MLWSTDAVASTDVVSLTDGMSLTDRMFLTDGLFDRCSLSEMSFGGDAVDGPCDIEER